MRFESDYAEAIEAAWEFAETDSDRTSLATLIDEAIDSYPLSADFLRRRGMIEFLLPDGECGKARGFLDAAYAIAPEDADVLCELGFWFDVCEDDPRTAFKYFRRSISRGGGVDTCYGLIRCLLQFGRDRFARRAIDRMEATWPGERYVRQLRDDLTNGSWQN